MGDDAGQECNGVHAAPGRDGRRGRTAASLACWFVVAACGGLAITQALGVDGLRHVAALQALTPYTLWLLAPAALVMLRLDLHAGAVLASVAGLGTLVLALPLVFPTTESADEQAAGVRIGVINLLYTNDRTDEIADQLVERDPDVVVFTELTTPHLDALRAHRLAQRLEHRIDLPGPLAGGLAIWSRFPLEQSGGDLPLEAALDARIDGPDGAFRLLAVHPPTPIYDFDEWRHDLDAIEAIARTDAEVGTPLLVAGDLNASFWHPRFRSLLDAGLTDAHIALGRGWSTSWPTDVVVPPYVRLDHALTGRGLVATAIEDFRVAGSDHAGFVVTVAPARRTMP